jgi:hypothetical protein
VVCCIDSLCYIFTFIYHCFAISISYFFLLLPDKLICFTHLLRPYFHFHLPLFCYIVLGTSTPSVVRNPIWFVYAWGIWFHLHLPLVCYIFPLILSFSFILCDFYIDFLHPNFRLTNIFLVVIQKIFINMNFAKLYFKSVKLDIVYVWQEQKNRREKQRRYQRII